MIRDLRVVSAAETFSILASLVTIPLLTRAFLPSEYGLYKFVFVLVSLFLLANALLNFDELLKKRLPELDGESQMGLIGAAAIVHVGVAVLSFSLATIAWSFGLLSHVTTELGVLFDHYVVVIGALFLMTPLYQFMLSVAAGTDEFGVLSVARVLREGSVLVAIVGLPFFVELSIGVVLWTYVAGNMLAIAVVGARLQVLSATMPSFDELVDQMNEISVPLVPRAIIKRVRTFLPDAIIVAAFGPQAFAAWSIAFSVTRVYEVFHSPFTHLFLPKLSGRLAADEPAGAIVKRYYRFIALITIPIVVGGWLLASDLVAYVFGPGYVHSHTMIALIVTAVGIQTMNKPSGYFFIATDNSVYETYNITIRSVARFAFLLYGAFVLHSLVVVALGYVLEQIASLGFALWYQRRHIAFGTPDGRELLKFLAALAVMGATVGAVLPLIDSMSTVVVGVGTGAVVYIATLIALGFFKDDDVDVVSRLLDI